MSEKVFAKGLFVDVKETKYGEIIKLSFKASEFFEFLKANVNDKGYMNVDILTNKEGKKYAVLNDFKPQQQSNNSEVPDLPF